MVSSVYIVSTQLKGFKYCYQARVILFNINLNELVLSAVEN